MTATYNIPTIIFHHAEQTPDKVAFYTVDGTSVSYSKLASCIRNAASLLKGLGAKAGDKILLSAQKEIEFIYLYFGAQLVGCINVVVDARNNAEHLKYIIDLVHPTLIFGINVERYESLDYSRFDFDGVPLHQIQPLTTKDDIAEIIFTSGTTGNPKGVMLSYANIYSSADNINRFIGNTSEDIELIGLPLCHSFGLGRVRCNMLNGATVVLHNGFANVRSVFNAIEKYGVTGFGMVPAIWKYIHKFSGDRISQFSKQIRYIEIGSAAMDLEDKLLLCKLFPNTRICMHYGLTEASRAVFMEFHDCQEDLSTIGHPVVPEVDVRILREDGTEAEIEEEGELCVKGNMVFHSYFLPKDNDGAFIRGYFRTGDWGRKSADDKLYLVARKKELINIGGKKVSPVEIEDALSKAGVGESMCIPIPDPDGVLGEVPKVLLVNGTFSDDIQTIKSRLALYLETYKIPKIFECVDSIPKTISGKKKRIQRG